MVPAHDKFINKSLFDPNRAGLANIIIFDYRRRNTILKTLLIGYTVKISILVLIFGEL